MVLRVHTTCALRPDDRIDDAARRGGDARQMAQEIQRGALGRQDAARRAADRAIRSPATAGCRRRARTSTSIAGSIRRNAVREVQTRDDARLARDQSAFGACALPAR